MKRSPVKRQSVGASPTLPAIICSLSLNISYMRNRMVDKSSEACSSQMRLVFAERPNEFVGEVQHVDNKRIPVEYHKHNTL